MTGRSDEELLAQLARKDAAATAELYERFYERAHRVAYRVLHDRDAAEDCAQEALARIVERASSLEASSFAGLVYQVVLNEARNASKKRLRRARHEEKAAKARPAASSSRIERGLEVAEVNAAVSELPEELRIPIVLHYFEGLSHDEVAKALEMPKGTAASRLRRGLEKLQEQLAAAGVAGVSALSLEENLRAAGAAPVPGPRTSAAKAALGGVRVATSLASAALLKTAAVIALVALVGVGGATVLLAPEPPPPARRAEVATPRSDSTASSSSRTGETSATTRAPELVNSTAPTAPETTPKPPVAEKAVAKKPVVTVAAIASGVVVTKDKKPVAGASVTAEIDDVAYVATAGADGRFVIHGPAPAKKDDLVWIEARDPKKRLLGARTLTPLPRKNLTLVLEPGAVVTGRVVDARTKAALAGASVEVERVGFAMGSVMVLEETASVSTADGTFRVGPLREGDVRAIARAKDRAPGRTKPLTVSMSRETDVEIELGLGATITGRVVDPDGKPLADAAVGVYFGPKKQALITPEDWLEEACSEKAAEKLLGRTLDPDKKGEMLGVGEDGKIVITDVEGRFTLEHIPAGKRLLIGVHARFKTAKTFVKLTADAATETTISVEKGGELHGFARTKDGKLATSGVACAMGTSAAGRWGRIDAAGRYSIPGLETGSYFLFITDDVAKDMPDFGRRQVVEVTAPARVRADIGPAPSGARVTGRILKGSTPVDNGAAMLLPQEGDERTALQALTEEKGAFSFTGVAPGRYVLRAGEMLSGSTRDVLISVPVGAGEVVHDVDLLQGSIEGTVTGPGKVGLAVAASVETGVEHLGVVWPDGKFTINGLAEGTYRVRAARGGVGVSHVEPVTVAKGARVAGLDLAVAEGQPLEVSVVDGDGDPCVGAHVVLAPAGERPLLAAGLLPEAAASEPDRVLLASVPDGRWDAWAFADGRAVGVVRGVEIGRDRSKKLVVKLPAAASLVVAVRDKEGQPVQGALLAVSDLEGRAVWPSPQGPKEGAVGPTDADGKASVALLPAGKVVVEARSGGKKARREVELTAGKQAEIALVLE